MTRAPPPKASRRGSGTGVRPFEPPQAGDAEHGAEFADEGQDMVGVAGGVVVVDPQEGELLGRGGRNEVESGRLFFDFQFVAELAVKFEGACGVVEPSRRRGCRKSG